MIAPMSGWRVIVTLLGAAVVCASLAAAQEIWVSGRVVDRVATTADFDGQFLYCRGIYNGGWRTDYPGADNNFSIRLAELTRIPVKLDANRQPHHVIVRLDDPALFRCPMLFMENVESLRGFSEAETAGLRDYLLKGGFLWVDDFWGSRAWANWEAHISSVLPPSEFPIFDLEISHPIMHSLFDVKEFLQVPNINFWYRSGGSVSERGYDSAEVHYRGIQNSGGNLMVLATHNTDVSDTWEREGASQEYFNTFSPRGYAIGVNVVVYALSH